MICQDQKMNAAGIKWGDSVRRHFQAIGLEVQKQMAEAAGVSIGTISGWLDAELCPQLQTASINRLTELFGVTTRELRTLQDVTPRAMAPRPPAPERGDPVEWSSILPHEIPIEAIAAALAHHKVSAHVIAEVVRQAAEDRSPRNPEKEASDAPGTRTSTPSRRGTQAS